MSGATGVGVEGGSQCLSLPLVSAGRARTAGHWQARTTGERLLCHAVLSHAVLCSAVPGSSATFLPLCFSRESLGALESLGPP